jgi:hypothetical protein
MMASIWVGHIEPDPLTLYPYKPLTQPPPFHNKSYHLPVSTSLQPSPDAGIDSPSRAQLPLGPTATPQRESSFPGPIVRLNTGRP